MRWTVSPIAQVELLNRLLELNHARYADEQAKGHGGKRNKPKPSQRDPEEDAGGMLFDPIED